MVPRVYRYVSVDILCKTAPLPKGGCLAGIPCPSDWGIGPMRLQAIRAPGNLNNMVFRPALIHFAADVSEKWGAV